MLLSALKVPYLVINILSDKVLMATCRISKLFRALNMFTYNF